MPDDLFYTRQYQQPSEPHMEHSGGWQQGGQYHPAQEYSGQHTQGGNNQSQQQHPQFATLTPAAQSPRFIPSQQDGFTPQYSQVPPTAPPPPIASAHRVPEKKSSAAGKVIGIIIGAIVIGVAVGLFIGFVLPSILNPGAENSTPPAGSSSTSQPGLETESTPSDVAEESTGGGESGEGSTGQPPETKTDDGKVFPVDMPISALAKVSPKDGVNVRKGPGTTYDIIIAAPYNAQVTIRAYSSCEKTNNWFFVEYGVHTGWVSSDFIEVIEGFGLCD